MITAEIKSNLKFPAEILTQQDLYHISEDICIPLLQAGIDTGTGVDGKPFPNPEPSTVKRSNRNITKRFFTKKGNIRATAIRQVGESGLKGFSKRILIETGKLRRAFWTKKKGKKEIHLTLESDRLKIGGYLQIDGIKTKKSGTKHYKFFGITDGMEAEAKQYMAEVIAQKCKDFNNGK